MATSVFTQYAIQDLHGHSLRYVSACKFFFFPLRRFRGSSKEYYIVPPLPFSPSPDGDSDRRDFGVAGWDRLVPPYPHKDNNVYT